MLLAGSDTSCKSEKPLERLDWLRDLQLKVIRQHVLLKVHDKSIWLSHISCLHKLTPASGSIGLYYQPALQAHSLLAAEQKPPQGFQDQRWTDARRSSQINGAGTKLGNIIWVTLSAILFLILSAICNYKNTASLKAALNFHLKKEISRTQSFREKQNKTQKHQLNIS